MAKIAQNSNAKPSAWIVSPKDKGRKSVKNGKVFLNNGDTFEIELFNPLKECVLSDIKLNGQSISKTGLVIKPGQRFYLDCFIDDQKKFIFSTYEVEDSPETTEATEKNGLLEVFFYKEEVISINNWKSRFDKIIVEKWYPYYYPYHRYYINPWFNTTGSGTYTTTDTYNNGYNVTGLCNTSYTSTSNVYNASQDYNSPITQTCFSNNIETGRIEKGGSSSQKFSEIDMDFESNYISSTIIQILPESRKPIESKDIKKLSIKDIFKRESDEIIELIKKLADLKEAGILTDQEFNDKKSDLLSKI